MVEAPAMWGHPQSCSNHSAITETGSSMGAFGVGLGACNAAAEGTGACIENLQGALAASVASILSTFKAWSWWASWQSFARPVGAARGACQCSAATCAPISLAAPAFRPAHAHQASLPAPHMPLASPHTRTLITLKTSRLMLRW